MLQEILRKKIRLIDYECLSATRMGNGSIGFGRYAGIVGAYNGIMTYGLRNICFN
jgi:saccharopine dehydrogenase (NAD+, L-lysine forming)